LGDLDVGGINISNLILERQFFRMWVVFMWLRIGTSSGLLQWTISSHKVQRTT
jgi:hypothetical protein